MKHSALSKALFNFFAWTIVIVVSFPLIWTIVTSLKPQTELFRIPPSLLPSTVTFEHYHKLLFGTKFLAYFGNSVIVSVAATMAASRSGVAVMPRPPRETIAPSGRVCLSPLPSRLRPPPVRFLHELTKRVRRRATRRRH